MKNRSNLLIVTSIFGAFSIILLFYAFSSGRNPIPGPYPLHQETNQEAIERCLTLQVMDKSYQLDGKVEVAYTNICPTYSFHLTKTGLKYNKSKKIKYLTRTTPVLVGPLSTETLELSIPFGIKPRVAYVLADDAKAMPIE